MEKTIDLKNTIKELIENLINRINEIYDMCIGDNDQFNYERIIFFVDDIKVLSEAIATLDEENFDLNEYNEKLNMALEAVEDRDHVLLGDILIFELKPLLEYWSSNI